MPSIEHEAAVQILHADPQLAAILLASCGVLLPSGAVAVTADSNLSDRDPTDLRSDNILIFEGIGGKVAVIAEVQKDKRDAGRMRSWPAYVCNARAEHDCDAILLVLALSARAAQESARLIRTGHPGFDLRPTGSRPRDAAASRASDLWPAIDRAQHSHRRPRPDQPCSSYVRVARHCGSARRTTRGLHSNYPSGGPGIGPGGPGGTHDDPPEGRLCRRLPRPRPRRGQQLKARRTYCSGLWPHAASTFRRTFAPGSPNALTPLALRHGPTARPRRRAWTRSSGIEGCELAFRARYDRVGASR